MLTPRALSLTLVVAATLLAAPAGTAGEVRLDLELGAAWQARNDFAVPGDTGTLVRLPDQGPVATGRATLLWDLGPRWSLRFLAAPLAVDDTVVPAEDVDFEGRTFPGGAPLAVDYEFNSYRAGVLYRWPERGRWSFAAGATLKVRDARIALAGSGLEAEKTDLGVVPLLYGAVRYRVAERLALAADLDGLAGPQGRAVDLTVRGELALGRSTSAFLGYRLLDGGADNDEVYTFATFHSAVAGLSLRF